MPFNSDTARQAGKNQKGDHPYYLCYVILLAHFKHPKSWDLLKEARELQTFFLSVVLK